MQKKIIILTSCGGISNVTVLRSTLSYESIQGRTKNIPTNKKINLVTQFGKRCSF